MRHSTFQNCPNQSAPMAPLLVPLQPSARPFHFSIPHVRRVVEAALHCAHRATTVSSWRLCEQEGHLTAPRSPTCGSSKLELEAACETRRTRVSFKRDPGGVEDSWSQPYCTSMLTVWVAMTGSWSFVAPVTVTLCVPLLRPFSSPEKPF